MSDCKWVLILVLMAVSAGATEPYEGLTGEERREIADSLDLSSRQAADAGDLAGALSLIDAALVAHPSHYRSWMNRWILQTRKGLQEDVPDEDLAAMILADLPRIQAGTADDDQTYVLTYGDAQLFQLTGDSTHLARRQQRLAAHVAEFPEGPRAFDFQLALARSVESHETARRHFEAAQRLASFSQRRRAWSQAALERGIERPDFMSDDDIRGTITQWYSTFAEIESEGERLREEANLVLWHGRLATVRDDSTAVAHLVEAYAHLRDRLIPYEEKILAQGWQAAIPPLGVMDARFDAMRGDLATMRGATFAASEWYRSAWQRLAPFFDDWDRSREMLSGEQMKKLRQRLVPYITP